MLLYFPGFKLSSFGSIDSVEEVILKWSLFGKATIHIFLTWCIWRNKNSLIFEGKCVSFEQLSFKIVGFYLEFAYYKVRKGIRVPSFPIIDGNSVVGFFDGASQMGSCGCGLYIKLSSSHVIYGWFGGGEGTNTRVELLAYWGLLFMASLRKVYSLHVCGDSKAVVDWVLGKDSL